MKGFIAVLALCVLSTSALAQSSRPQLSSMTCGAASSLIKNRGAVVVDTGPNTFERLVASEGFCQRGETAIPYFTPTRDNRTCMAGYECRDIQEWIPNQ
jgi:hypothetical protein